MLRARGLIGELVLLFATVALLLCRTSPSHAQAPACLGDCDGNGEVTVEEILTLVNMALGGGGNCPNGLAAAVTPDVSVILEAVSNALNGCSATAAIDAKAVNMAAQILAGGDQTEPALQQAILDAGFTIQAPDGTLTQPTGTPSQGMLFTQWDVDVMAAVTNNGGFVTLNDFAAAIQLAFPELDTTQISANILAGLSDSAQSDQLTVRLWARLIVELSRQREVSYDLLAPNVDPTQAELGLIQVNLLTVRFIGDVLTMVDGTATGSPAAASAVATSVAPSPLWLGMPAARAIQPRADSTPPCTLTDTQQMIMDGAAKAETKGFKKLVSYLETKGVAGAGTLGKISGRLSAVLDYVKLLASLLSFNIDFKADLSELVRTLSTVNGGQQMKITATVSFDNGNFQLLNCVRQVGNLFGVDFKLTPTGLIKNAEINWYLLEGDTQGIAGVLGYLRWAQGSVPNVNRYTDGNGQDTITIEGAPQRKTFLDPHSVEKPGKVHAKINLESANIVKDLLAAIGGVATLPVEMAYRTGLLFERSQSFTVVDWEDCSTATGMVRVRATNVCRNTWTGTSSFTLGADPSSGVTTSANVTWVFKQAVGDVVYYQPTGTASFTFPNCVVSPSSEAMLTQPGGGTSGDLAIDFGADPPTYQVQGATVWGATYSCTGASQQMGAGGLWVGDPNTFQAASGTVAFDENTRQLTINGSASSPSGSSSWNFTKD